MLTPQLGLSVEINDEFVSTVLTYRCRQSQSQGETFPLMTTLTSPHDLLAAIPFLIGYHPTDSLVLVSLKDEAVGMAMRVDYPHKSDSNEFVNSCDLLVSHLTRECADGALIVAYSPADRNDGLEILDQIAASLARAGISLQESLLIFRNKWRSVLCTDRECCPLDGRELPEIRASRIAVEQIAEGRRLPFSDLAELEDSISTLPLAHDEYFISAVVGNRVDSESDDIQQIQREGAVGVIDLVSRFIAGSMGQDFVQDQEISAKVLGKLSDIQIRDFALGSHNDATLEIYWTMWRYLTRIAPSGFIAPVASLLAAVSYEKGDGALAHRALDRALRDDPAYSLALLLRRVFTAGWPPESFARMRKELHPKVCAGIFERNL